MMPLIKMSLNSYICAYTTGHDSLRTVFRYAQKVCGKDFFGETLLFLIKIFNFYQKQQRPSDRFFSTLKGK